MSETPSTRRTFVDWILNRSRESASNETTSKLERSPDVYLVDRVQFKINAYAKKAEWYRRWYWTLASVAGIGSLFIPVLVNYPNMPRYVPTLVSLGVAISVGLQSVLHPREHWRNYDSISSILREEEMRFSTKTRPYADAAVEVNDPNANPAGEVNSQNADAAGEVNNKAGEESDDAPTAGPESRFNKFVERVEAAIARERADTIGMRTSAPAGDKN